MWSDQLAIPVASFARIAGWLVFASDAMFPVGFDHPDWHDGFEHDPEESARVRLGLFEDLALIGGRQCM